MADQHSTAAELREALAHVFDTMARVDTLFRAFDAACVDAPEPPWLSTIRLVYQPSVDASERLECLLRQRVLPILDGTVIEGEVS